MRAAFVKQNDGGFFRVFSFYFFLPFLFCWLVSWLSQPSGIFLHQLPLHHDLMSAAYALQSEISSDPKHFPLLAPARMRLLHRNDIAYIKSVCHIISFLRHQSTAVRTPCTRKRSSSRTFVHVDRLTICDCAVNSTSSTL